MIQSLIPENEIHTFEPPTVLDTTIDHLKRTAVGKYYEKSEAHNPKPGENVIVIIPKEQREKLENDRTRELINVTQHLIFRQRQQQAEQVLEIVHGIQRINPAQARELERNSIHIHEETHHLQEEKYSVATKLQKLKDLLKNEKQRTLRKMLQVKPNLVYDLSIALETQAKVAELRYALTLPPAERMYSACKMFSAIPFLIRGGPNKYPLDKTSAHAEATLMLFLNDLNIIQKMDNNYYSLEQVQVLVEKNIANMLNNPHEFLMERTHNRELLKLSDERVAQNIHHLDQIITEMEQ